MINCKRVGYNGSGFGRPGRLAKGVNMLKLKNPDLLCRHCFILDEWVNADSGKTVDVNNPATGEVLGTVPFCGADETQRAINAANESLDAWRSKIAGERSVILRRWHDLLMENQSDLAAIMTAEQGKPWRNPRGKSPMPPLF